MPTKVKKNYAALAHSDPLAELAKQVHVDLEKGKSISQEDIRKIIQLANNLLNTLHSPVKPDNFLVESRFNTEAPGKTEPAIEKMPTVTTPAVKPEPEKQKSGFLGRG
jgi:hypothetical protein